MPTVIWVKGADHLEDLGIHIHSEEELGTVLEEMKKDKSRNETIYMHEI